MPRNQKLEFECLVAHPPPRKTKMMWDVQRIHGSSGKNAAIIKAFNSPKGFRV